MHELGARGEHCPNLRDVPCADRVRQTRNRHTVDVRLQLGPAVEAVRACDHELRVVERESRRLGAAKVAIHFRGGVGLAGAERLEQFLRLPFQLIEGGVLAKRTSWKRTGRHDELLSWLRLRVNRSCPVSARSGGKEVIGSLLTIDQVDAVLPADTGAP